MIYVYCRLPMNFGIPFMQGYDMKSVDVWSQEITKLPSDKRISKKLSKEELIEIGGVIDFINKTNELEKGQEGYMETTETEASFWNRAVCYDLGIGTKHDSEKAHKYYRLAFAQHQINSMSLDQQTKYHNRMSNVLLQDEPAIFEEAASLGYPTATYLLGLCHFNALGTPENDYKANELFLKAYKAGYYEACLSIGCQYEHGRGGFPKDQQKAYDYFLEGYNHGDLECGFNVAVIIYNSGREAEAIKLLRELAAKGHDRAKQALRQMGYNA